MPGKSVIWINQRPFIREKNRTTVGRPVDLPPNYCKSGQIKVGEDEGHAEQARCDGKDFIDPSMLEALLNQYPLVEMGGGKPGNGYAGEIRFSSAWEQPAVNRQFDLLIKNLRDHERKQYNVFMFSKQPQTTRGSTAFYRPESGNTGNADRRVDTWGFIDHDLKLICYRPPDLSSVTINTASTSFAKTRR